MEDGMSKPVPSLRRHNGSSRGKKELPNHMFSYTYYQQSTHIESVMVVKKALYGVK